MKKLEQPKCEFCDKSKAFFEVRFIDVDESILVCKNEDCQREAFNAVVDAINEDDGEDE